MAAAAAAAAKAFAVAVVVLGGFAVEEHDGRVEHDATGMSNGDGESSECGDGRDGLETCDGHSKTTARKRLEGGRARDGTVTAGVDEDVGMGAGMGDDMCNRASRIEEE